MSIGGLKKAWVLNSRHTPEGLPPPPICMQQPSRRLQRQLWDSASSWAPMSQPSPAQPSPQGLEDAWDLLGARPPGPLSLGGWQHL